jgi:hypothetical protein
MDFQWSTQTTGALFRDSASGILNPEPIPSQIRYLSRTYTLDAIQFTAPIHSSWVIPATAQAKVQEEIVMTFRTADKIVDQTPNTLILTVPILRDDTAAVEPPFLLGIANPNDLKGNVSPKDLIPTWQNNLYAYYSICAQGMASGDTPQYIEVLVFTRGLPVKSATMTAIMSMMNSAQVAAKFGPYEPPGFILNTATGEAISETNFPARVKHAYNLMEPLALQPAASAIMKEVPTDAFKCVPLNPETDIANGKIIIDTVTGETLADVNAAREATKVAATSKLNLTAFADILKNWLSYVLAGAFILLLFFILLSGSGEIGVPGEEAGAMTRLWILLSGSTGIIVFGIVAGFVGFAVGFFLK